MRAVEPRMVFVGGAHRSGTTVLAQVMAASPELAGLVGTGVPMDEGQHLQSVLPTAAALGGAARWALDPRAHAVEADPGDRAAMRSAISDAWQPFWSSDAALRVEKSPPNVTRMRFLQSLWPDARFIVITRHPMIQSLAIQKWDHSLPGFLPKLGLGIDKTLENWCEIHDMLAADAPHLDRLLVLRYEHLMADPQGELAKVSDFLELSEPLDADRIQPSRGDTYRTFVEGQRDRRWGPHVPVMAPKPFTTARRRAAFRASWEAVSRYDALTGRYSRLARRFEERARTHGYSMLDLDAVAAFPAHGA
ncbi:sulfotransferase family protein [Demequina subtropica]|uniref:sulfotransferase family protein n=1 Tax=Demequina subtropica TaxID=1638989 RepID=UPI000782BD55|nr:sulfotransferase [Demequina subtropica]